MRIGLFGGSFNPPHLGHGMVCYTLLETDSMDEVWLIPTFRHAFQKPLAPYEDRVAMCRLLAEAFQGRVQVSEVERGRNDLSYTIDTVRRLLDTHPHHEFQWIVGSDILAEMDRWRDIQTLRALIPFRILPRQGYPGGTGVEIPAVSSSEIRDRLRLGQPADDLLTRKVLDHVVKLGLYLDSTA